MKKFVTFLIVLMLIATIGLMQVSCNNPHNNDDVFESNGIDYSNRPYLIKKSDKNIEIKNLILIIGDGMGIEHITAGELASDTFFNFTDWQHVTVNTDSLGKKADDHTARHTTDSAAAATALATGTLTFNGYVGKDANDVDLETIMDFAIKSGKATGIVTTDEMTGATPGGFSAHSLSRENIPEIISTQIESNINLLCATFSQNCANAKNKIEKAGYTYCNDFEDVDELEGTNKAYCLFDFEGKNTNDNAVKLKDATSFAIDYLENQNKDGYVLMIEQAYIDKFSHNNDFNNMVKMVKSLNDTVETILSKVGDDTAILITADHETGMLSVSKEENLANKYSNNCYYAWEKGDHSESDVGLFVYGIDVDFAEMPYYGVSHHIKNTDTFKLMKKIIRGDYNTINE